MHVLAVTYFFVMFFGLGSLVTLFFKNWSAGFVERQIARLMLGIPLFILLSTILSLLGFIGFRMHWTVFAAIALLGLISLVLQRQKFVWSKECWIGLAAILLCVISVFVMVKGSFNYSWLEDSDPWNHAMGAKYVAVTGMGVEPVRGGNVLKYIDAYLPAYDVLMGMIHQLDNNLSWILKFFNSVLVGLSVLFGYIAFKKLLKSAWWGLLAAFFLLMIPCFLSHFIWVHVFAPIMFFAILYCFENNFLVGGIISFAGLGLTHIEHLAKIGLLFVAYGVLALFLMKDKRKVVWLSIVLGLLLSLLVWWIPMLISYGSVESLVKVGLSQAENPLIMQKISSINFVGSATRPYSFMDFFIAKGQNMINNPVGVGIVLFSLVMIGIVLVCCLFKKWKEHPEYLICLVWFVMTLFYVMGWIVQLVPFRAWMLLAIPSVLLACIATKIVWEKIGILKYALLLGILVGVVLTSGIQKYELNTSIWHYGWLTEYDAKGYEFFWSLPTNSKILIVSVPKRAYAYNLMVDAWNPEFINVYDSLITKNDVGRMSGWLLLHNYSYIVFDGTFLKDYGENITNQFIQNFLFTEQWQPIYNREIYVLGRR